MDGGVPRAETNIESRVPRFGGVPNKQEAVEKTKGETVW